MGIIIRGGIARGAPERELGGHEKTDLWEKAGLDAVLGAMTRGELILRYTLTHPHCQTTIVGTVNLDHLSDNVAAAEKGPLPVDLYEEVRRRVAEVLSA